MDSIQRAAQDRSQVQKSFLPDKGSLLLLTASTIGVRVLTKTSLPAAVGGGLVITLVSRCLWKKCANTPIVTLFFAVFRAQYPGDILRSVSAFIESSRPASKKQNPSPHVRQGVPMPPNMPRPPKNPQGGRVAIYHPLSDMIQNHRLAVMMLRGTNWQLSRMSYHISERCHRLFQPFGLPLRTLILAIDRFWQFFRGSPDSIVDRLYLNTFQNQHFSEEQASSFYRNLSSILTPDQKRKLATVLEKNTNFKEELKNPKNHQKLLFDQSEDSIELTDEQRKELFPPKAQSKQYRPMIQQTLIHPNDQSKLPSQVKSYQIWNIFPHGAIEIHNSAMFQIHPGDMHKAAHWNISDHITFSPNSAILGDSEYFITNSTQKGEPVRANLSRGPFYDNPATTRFKEIDHKKCEVALKNGHGDLYRFAVERDDMHCLKSCKLGETAMIGTNDSSLLSWLFSSPPLILTSYENGEFFLYARCTHKSSTMGNRANNSGSASGS